MDPFRDGMISGDGSFLPSLSPSLDPLRSAIYVPGPSQEVTDVVRKVKVVSRPDLIKAISLEPAQPAIGLIEPPLPKYSADEIAGWNEARLPPMEPDGLRYRFPLEPAEFCKLQTIIDDRNQSWPRYEYDDTNHIAIVQLMPSAIHHSVCSVISNGIVGALSAMPPAVRRQFHVRGAVSRVLKLGRYMSTRIPDVELRSDVNGNGIKKTVMVVETGFSQSYESLRQDVQQWFDGCSSMRMVILVDVNEKPSYKNPLRGLSAEDIISLLAATAEEEVVEAQPGSPWAGFCLRGFPFFGALDGYLEVWIRDADGQPKMREPRHNFIPPNPNESPLNLGFSELSTIADVQDIVVSPSWDEIRDTVCEGAREWAYTRSEQVLGKVYEGEGYGDPDYVPQVGDDKDDTDG